MKTKTKTKEKPKPLRLRREERGLAKETVRQREIMDEQRRQGRDAELADAVQFLRQIDGIGSGADAAAALERKEHRR